MQYIYYIFRGSLSQQLSFSQIISPHKILVSYC